MTTELLHGDLCPLCGQPLTLRPTVTVAQRWNDLMNDRYGL
ncbi:hypothetical protein [Streptomyces sp. NPDC006307]